MKKINLVLFASFMLSLALLPLESVFAVDVPLKSADPSGSGGVGTNNMMTTMSVSSMSTSTIPVTADIINGELGVFFSRSVGIAYIYIIDQNGTIVDAEILDTNADLELYIPMSSWTSGRYTLKISYGATNLKGTFRL